MPLIRGSYDFVAIKIILILSINTEIVSKCLMFQEQIKSPIDIDSRTTLISWFCVYLILIIISLWGIFKENLKSTFVIAIIQSIFIIGMIMYITSSFLMVLLSATSNLMMYIYAALIQRKKE